MAMEGHRARSQKIKLSDSQENEKITEPYSHYKKQFYLLKVNGGLETWGIVTVVNDINIEKLLRKIHGLSVDTSSRVRMR